MSKKEYHKQLQDGIDEMEATIECLREEINQLLKQKADLSKEIKELQKE